MQHKYSPTDLGNYDKTKKIVIVKTEWNSQYVDALAKDCEDTLREKGLTNIETLEVPWSLELTYWAVKAFEKYWADVCVVIWTVIRWDTSHYDHVCDWVTRGIINLQIEKSKPIVFWLLTCENERQVEQRMKKGKEWALSAIQLSKI